MKEEQDCEKKSLKQFIKQLVCNYTFVIILFVILIGCDIFIHWTNIRVEDVSIVLSFTGILATIIVISNYMQVKYIESDCKESINELKKQNKDYFDNLETQIKTLKDYNYIVAYNKSNIKPSKGIDENLKQQILQVLGTKSMTIESIANSILDDNNDDIYAVIYEMLNAEELIIVGNEFATNFDSYIVKKKR